MLNHQRIFHHFPLVFLWFSNFSIVFLRFSYDFPIFRWCSHRFTEGSPWSPKRSRLIPGHPRHVVIHALVAVEAQDVGAGFDHGLHDPSKRVQSTCPARMCIHVFLHVWKNILYNNYTIYVYIIHIHIHKKYTSIRSLGESEVQHCTATSRHSLG